jgi:hypothetical protein
VRGGEFYDRRTSLRFVPRGNSYVRLGPVQTATGVITDHNTLNVGTYDAGRAEAALERMRDDGYNLVRVFLNPNCIDACLGDPTTRGLRAAYVANLADFLRRAKANGLVVMLEGHDAPPNTVYASLINSEPRTYIENVNLNLLTSGGVQAHALLWHDLIGALLAQGAPTDAIFGIDPYVEAFFDTLHKPFTLGSGLITTGNGATYDIADPSQRNAMMDDNLVYFVDRVRDSVRSVDPTALVTVSFFAPQEPNPWRVTDFRLIRTKAVFDRSSLDFFTIHPYPGSGLVLPHLMQNFGLAGTEEKPIVFGEFGAYADPPVYASAADAAPALQQWQADSCAYGVDGWILWTWDTGPQPDGVTLWNALDDGGRLEHALAPNDRPDACAATAPRDLAFDRPATASASLQGEGPALAVDLGHANAWRSGSAAPQWIELDLGASSTIGKVRLTERQVGFPLSLGGRVLGGPDPNPSTELFQFGDPSPLDGRMLEFTGAWPDVRYLRIETTLGLEVGWREIEAYGP